MPKKPAAAPNPPTYHRKGNQRTQTDDDARKILESGELWGKPPYNNPNGNPAVQAFEGPLPDGRWGIEFTAEVPPDATSQPGLPEWRGARPGVRVETETDGQDYAKIDVVVTRVIYENGEEEAL